MKNTHLLIIDPQNDFCDPLGSLYVPGAEKDMERVSEIVDYLASELTQIHVTLDQHHLVDVAHPLFWIDGEPKHPKPFTSISAKDVANRVWVPTVPEYYDRMLSYTRALEVGGKYPLCIWPPHCLIGSTGANVHYLLLESLHLWEMWAKKPVNFVQKGMNIFTEHYSAIKAEVVDPDDPTTFKNCKLLNELREADEILVAGEALTHCVANTVDDLIDEGITNITLLIDGMSPVPGFQVLQENFLSRMKKHNVKIGTTVEYL
jgi:nicotinamidase-related amidase